jgi:hypothetical protein
MKRCIVSMRGKDGQVHTFETDADSLFQAATAGIECWAQFWWFDPDTEIEVKVSGISYYVSQDQLEEYRPRP